MIRAVSRVQAPGFCEEITTRRRHSAYSCMGNQEQTQSRGSAGLHRPPQRQSRKAKRGVIYAQQPLKKRTYAYVCRNSVRSCTLLRSMLPRALTWFKLDMDTTAVLLELPPPAIEPVKHKNPSAYADTPESHRKGRTSGVACTW